MNINLIIVSVIISLTVAAVLVASIILFLKKYARSYGHYYTQVDTALKLIQSHEHLQEDEGEKLAEDANMAVLKAKTGHEVKYKKEWFI